MPNLSSVIWFAWRSRSMPFARPVKPSWQDKSMTFYGNGIEMNRGRHGPIAALPGTLNAQESLVLDTVLHLVILFPLTSAKVILLLAC